MVLVPTLLALTVLPFPQRPATASCAAPYLQVDRGQTLERRGQAVVEGRAFVDGCRDAMGCSEVLGCTSCDYEEPPETPMEDVRLRLLQGGRAWILGVADADTAGNGHLGWITWRFDVPIGVEPGRARLVPDGGETAPVRIR
jgi:hypothetical protein